MNNAIGNHAANTTCNVAYKICTYSRLIQADKLHYTCTVFDYSSLGIHAESHGNCVIGGIQLYMSI